MRAMERGVRWVGVAAAVFLLPWFLGCTATLDQRPADAAAKRSVATEAAAETAPVEPAAAAAGAAAAPDAPDEALTAFAGGAITPAPAADEPLEPTLRIHEIGLTARDGHQAIVIRLSRPPDGLRDFTLSGPSRLVVDVEGPQAAGARGGQHAIDAGGVARLRVGEHADRLRIVADLERPLPGYDLVQEGRTVVLVLPSETPVPERQVYLAPGVLPAALRALDTAVAGIEEAAPTSEGDTAEPVEVASDPGAVASDPAAPSYEPAVEATADADPADAATGAEPAIGTESIAAPAADEPAAADGALATATEPLPPADAAAPPADPVDLAAAPLDPVVDEAEGSWETEGEDVAYVLPVQEATGRERELVSGGADEFTGQRISLDFKDADIQNVLRILADVSGLNIITTEDVGGKLTIRLMDVPWDQALGAILKAQGLDMVRDGSIVRISTVEKLKAERDAQREADEAQKKAEPLKVKYVRVNYAKADEALVKKIQEVLTERGSATWDERTNTIVVRDIARGIASAEELIAEFDTQTPQVLIEANIVEATESFARDLGVQWGYTYRAGPEIGNAPGTNFPGRVGAGGILGGTTASPATAVPFIADFPAAVGGGQGAAYDLLLGSLDGAHSLNARLTALERQGKGKVISRPRVVTLNNIAAKIESLEILRVKLPSTGTVISTGAGGAAGAAQNATEQIRTGITLEVTPQVSSDGYIFLDVFAKSSALQDPSQSRAPSPDGIPNEVSREAESHVLIKDGETFVLGGVFRNVLDRNDRGVPFLSSIPVLGWAFKNQADIDNRQELLVFVTPRAVRARGTENLASLPSAESLWQNRGNP